VIFVLGLLIPLAFVISSASGSSQLTEQEKVQEWLKVRDLSLKDKPQACLAFSKLDWLNDFPHQDLVQFKIREYCRTPPEINQKDPDQLVTLAKFYREEFQYAEAKKVIKDGLKLAKKKQQKIDLLEEQLKLDQIEQNKSSRLKTLSRLSQLNSEKYSVDYARILWTYNQRSKAEQILKSADKKWAKNISRQPLYFVLARMAEEKKQIKAALQLYGKSWKQPNQDSEYYKGLVAQYGWFLYKQGDFSKSLEVFEKFDLKWTDRLNLSRAQFWSAKSLKKLGRENEAKKRFEDLISEDPVGYYSLLAHRELGKFFEPLGKEDLSLIKPLEKHSLINKTMADKWRWSEILNERVFIESLAQQISQDFYTQKKSDQKILLHAFWKVGLSNFLTKLFAQAPVEQRRQAYHESLFYLFPTPYFQDISEAAKKQGLDPFLVMSLIRQESGFNPMARSPTDALGLMQVMPKVAKRIARVNKMKWSNEKDLLIVDKNLFYGTMELSERLREFKNNLVLAIASYNAGPEPVKSWVKTRNRKDILEFIEEIPYEETRSYVRLILRNQIIYHQLQTKESFPFPSEWIKPLP
jgi:soluble lytic murein transglycosylase